MKRVFATAGKSYANLKTQEKTLLKTSDEAMKFLASNLKDIYDKVSINFIDDDKNIHFSIYLFGGKWLNLDKAKKLIHEWLGKE